MNKDTFITKGRNWGRRFCRCWVKADCSTQAAAISCFSGLSIFPFVAVLITAIGWFFTTFETGNDAEREVLKMLEEVISPEMSAAVGNLLASVQSQAHVGGPIAAVILLYLSSRVFSQIDRAFQAIFGKKLVQKRSAGRSALSMVARPLRSIVLVLSYGAVVLLVFYGGTVLFAVESLIRSWFPDIEGVGRLRATLFSLGISTVVFGSLYRFLSRATVRWKLSYGVGFFVAVLWELGRVMIASLVIGEKYTALGVIGSFMAILVWVYCNSMVLLAGAVLVRVLADGESDGEPERLASADPDGEDDC
jgi:membrane protein